MFRQSRAVALYLFFGHTQNDGRLEVFLMLALLMIGSEEKRNRCRVDIIGEVEFAVIECMLLGPFQIQN